MGHLPKGGVREAPTSERSFLAGETERVCEPPIGSPGNAFHHGFGNASLFICIAGPPSYELDVNPVLAFFLDTSDLMFGVGKIMDVGL